MLDDRFHHVSIATVMVVPEAPPNHIGDEAATDDRVVGGEDLCVDVLPPHGRHVYSHSSGSLQRSSPLRLHHHLQGTVNG